MRRPKRSEQLVLLTVRDKRIIRFLFESKLATQRQIGRLFFPNVAGTTVARRLRRLVKEKYIEKLPLLIAGKCRAAYRATKFGVSKFTENIPYEMDREILKSDSEEHDMILVDIIEKLKMFKIVDSVISENSLQCYKDLREDDFLDYFAALRSDGVVKMKINDSYPIAALEYERSVKKRGRYVKKFKAYYEREKITGVLFVCESERMKNLLLQIDKSICKGKESKFFFSTIKDLLSAEEKVNFTDCKGRIFSIY